MFNQRHSFLLTQLPISSFFKAKNFQSVVILSNYKTSNFPISSPKCYLTLRRKVIEFFFILLQNSFWCLQSVVIDFHMFWRMRFFSDTKKEDCAQFISNCYTTIGSYVSSWYKRGCCSLLHISIPSPFHQVGSNSEVRTLIHKTNTIYKQCCNLENFFMGIIFWFLFSG